MRRRRRRAEEHTSHDRWLVSYADFMTLLFALFVVLFASSYRDNLAVRRLSHAIQIGFQKLGAFSGGEINRGVAYPDIPPDSSNYTPPIKTPIPAQTVEAAIGPPVDIVELQRQLEQAIGEELKKHEVVMRVTPEGFVISLKELGFFNSGQAVLLPGAAGKIERIAAVLMKDGLELRIEGHTDDQPIHTDEFNSNWELSTARAMAVMTHLLNSSGFNPKRISIASYGEYRPVADNATPEGRRMNRRVDLVVVAAAHPQQP